MAQESPKVIVLQTADGAHVGFNLFHPNLDADSGDCVFIIAPKDKEILENNLVKALNELKGKGEYQWEKFDSGIKITQNGELFVTYINESKKIIIANENESGKWLIVQK